MRQRQRDSSCGVDTAATCTRLPPTPTRASTAARIAAKASWLRVLHFQRPPIQLMPVELLDCRIGRFARRHLDEAEATGAARLSIHDDLCGFHDTNLGENLP
jgi:hypothetical protein